MIFRIFIFLWCIPIHGLAQDETNATELRCRVQGKIMQTSKYQGGVEDPFPPKPFPLSNYTLVIVQLTNTDSIPVQMGKITSDSLGNFEVFLPAGTYGLVRETDLPDLKPGQYLPSSEYSAYTEGIEYGESFSSHWVMSGFAPIEVNKAEITGVVITNNQMTYCNMCP